MDKGNKSNRCTAVIGSMTKAMNAKQVLGNSAIISEVIKVSGNTFGGCVYGVSFPCVLENNVRNALRMADISIKRIING